MVQNVQNDVAGALRLFASVFAREVDEALLDTLDGRRVEITEALGADPLVGLDLDDRATVLEALAVEYCRLFVGPHGHLPPVESVARGEGRFWGPSTEVVDRFYASAGLSVRREAHVVPDHLSMELDCLALLEEGDRHDEAKAFAEEHVLQWLPRLMAHLTTHVGIPFYRVWCRGLQRMLEELYAQ